MPRRSREPGAPPPEAGGADIPPMIVGEGYVGVGVRVHDN